MRIAVVQTGDRLSIPVERVSFDREADEFKNITMWLTPKNIDDAVSLLRD